MAFQRPEPGLNLRSAARPSAGGRTPRQARWILLVFGFLALVAALWLLLDPAEVPVEPGQGGATPVQRLEALPEDRVGLAPLNQAAESPAEAPVRAMAESGERALLANSAQVDAAAGELHLRLVRWPLRYDLEEPDALSAWAWPEERLQLRVRDNSGRQLSPEFRRLDSAHLDIVCRGAAPISVLAYQPGFQAAWLTASEAQVSASAKRPLELKLLADAKLQLVWPSPPGPGGLDLFLVAASSWIPWTRPTMGAFGKEWPSEPIRVPSGGFDLWVSVGGLGSALYRDVVLAPGELRQLEVVLQPALAAGVLLNFSPSGEPMRQGQVYVNTPARNPVSPGGGLTLDARANAELTNEGLVRLPPLAPGPFELEICEAAAGLRFSVMLLAPLSGTPRIAVPEPGSLRGRIQAGREDLTEQVLWVEPLSQLLQPAAGLQIPGLLSNTPIKPVQLSATGDFEVPRLAPGTWELRLRPRPPEVRRIKTPAVGGTARYRYAPLLGTVTVLPGSTVEFHGATPAEEPGILELLLLVDGQPLAGRMVTLYARSEVGVIKLPGTRPAGERLHSMHTDASGRVRFEGLPRGSYLLTTCSLEAGPFVLSSGEHERVELSLANLRADIAVESEEGQRLAGSQVAVRRRGSGWYLECTLDAAGVLRLRDYAGSFEFARLEHLRPRDPATPGPWVALELGRETGAISVQLPSAAR